MSGITLQINLAPFDYRHAKSLLPHQIGTFDDGIDEILLTYDDGGGKQRKPGWEAADAAMRRIMENLATHNKLVSICPIQYDEDSRRRVSSYFCSRGKLLPLYDFRGAPFYQYFYGLHMSRNDLILHMDSDMFFGGGGRGWLAGARTILESDPKVLTVSPHPGPPHPMGIIKGQIYEPYGSLPRSYAFKTVSTRLFFMDRKSLRDAIIPRRPGLLKIAWALHKYFPPWETAESCITETMQKAGRLRVDVLGEGGGIWSLHPPRRSERFFAEIENIISRLRDMDVPEDQLGYYDFTDSFFDWGEKVKSYK